MFNNMKSIKEVIVKIEPDKICKVDKEAKSDNIRIADI